MSCHWQLSLEEPVTRPMPKICFKKLLLRDEKHLLCEIRRSIMNKPSLKVCLVNVTLISWVSLIGFFPAKSKAVEGIQEIQMNLNALAYDPFTQRLYGAGTNNLLQIDPN